MVRKQLYLEEYQNKALKQRAKELNISEAELVRRALDRELKAPVQNRPKNKELRLLDELFSEFDRLAKQFPVKESYTLKRQELYEEDERFTRWE